MDTTALRKSFDTFLEAAATAAGREESLRAPADGEWDAERILAHVAIVSAAALSAASTLAAGTHPVYDNRLAQDRWTAGRIAERAGGPAGLVGRIAGLAAALCALDGPALSDAELDTPIPALLLSHDAVMLEGPVPLRDLLTGLAEVEIPGHTAQLLTLLS